MTSKSARSTTRVPVPVPFGNENPDDLKKRENYTNRLRRTFVPSSRLDRKLYDSSTYGQISTLAHMCARLSNFFFSSFFFFFFFILLLLLLFLSCRACDVTIINSRAAVDHNKTLLRYRTTSYGVRPWRGGFKDLGIFFFFFLNH